MAIRLKRMALCKGRHDMPSEVQGAIFDCEVNPLDPNGLLREVIQSKKLENIDYLMLYVTGLTVALIAVMNACKMLGVRIMLMHYNKDTGEYYPQEVL